MNQSMGLKEAVSSVFHKYADFSGRARRSEYWYFFLFDCLVYLGVFVLYYFIAIAGIATGGVALIFGGGFLLPVLYGIYSLAVIVPWLAVSCRRLHDIGRAGSYLLFVLIPIVGWIFLLIWFLQDGDHGANQYGPDPKGFGNGSPATDPVHHYTQAPASAGNARQYAEQKSSLYLEGVTGYYAGKRISVRGTMVAGRNPGCAIQFPGDTHGISHRHCQFRADGSSIIVTDLGSTYGTYINGANRLKPNHPLALSKGDTVSLGSQKQCFTVR